MSNRKWEFNLNLREGILIEDLAEEFPEYYAHYNFRDDTSKITFTENLLISDISIFVAGRLIDIACGTVTTVDAKGRVIKQSKYLVDCISIHRQEDLHPE